MKWNERVSIPKNVLAYPRLCRFYNVLCNYQSKFHFEKQIISKFFQLSDMMRGWNLYWDTFWQVEWRCHQLSQLTFLKNVVLSLIKSQDHINGFICCLLQSRTVTGQSLSWIRYTETEHHVWKLRFQSYVYYHYTPFQTMCVKGTIPMKG